MATPRALSGFVPTRNQRSECLLTTTTPLTPTAACPASCKGALVGARSHMLHGDMCTRGAVGFRCEWRRATNKCVGAGGVAVSDQGSHALAAMPQPQLKHTSDRLHNTPKTHVDQTARRTDKPHA
jgi:hypothetical protein